MENTEQFEEPIETAHNPQLIVTEDMRSFIYDMAKWASFLAIVGFGVSALMFISALTVGPLLNSNPEMAKMLGQLGAMGGNIFSIVCIIYGLAFFYPSFLLSRYASKAKQGVLYGDQNSLDEAIAKLKSLFKYFGILAIIIIGLYILTLFSSIAGGLMKAS
ncbi:DUF5362 family protein [Pedobacter sp. ASV28]|jgi:Family of unknown function (DUF5362)|uniref:DUF5362 family protein n=1 Tax=Pedobacter sp. ASV28 TaxID=2795123 RepID=UPI0018EBD965|nr:DUF5362 family protein [Pedobacter sp. ASV28]